MLMAAQEIINDTSVVERNGRMFHRYIVEPGNTLYSIARVYGISVQEIQEFNPSSKGGLSIGDTLYLISIDQDAKKRQMNMEVDGNFIIHEVQKGQTLYAISKLYEVKVSELYEVNPESQEGVKPGQLIRIPVARLKKQETAVALPSQDKVFKHTVESKETLYSLSRRYQVGIEQIKSANGGLTDGLKVGQVLIIPKVDSDTFISPDTTIMKDQYQVSIILPFFLNLNDTLMAKRKIDQKEVVVSKSFVAIQFYEGCLMAIDSLKKLGMEFKVKFYDSGKDSNVVNRLINTGELKNSDLIIGPFYQSQFLRVAEYAKREKIHIVSPVPLSNRVLLGNAYASKVATSQNILYRNLGEYIQRNYGTENILLITKLFRINPLAEAFEKSYHNHAPAGIDSIKNPIKEIKWDNGSIDPIKHLLSDSLFNIIVIPSSDQVYVTELLSKLNPLNKDYIFKVIGTENWLKYSNLDVDYLENLHVSIPVDAYTNFKQEEVKRFIRSFERRFEVFPESFSFLGFDVCFFYLNMLNKNGTRFESSLEQTKERYLYRQFNFFKTGIESGYENSSLRILEQRGFELREVH